MSTPEIPEIAPDRCWTLLPEFPYGRIALSVADRIHLFPVNHLVHGDSLYFCTAEGSKLAAVAVGHPVVFEVDEVSAGRARSVVVEGRAEQVEDAALVEELEAAHLYTHAPTEKPYWVRITPEHVSGREFEIAGTDR